MALIDFTDLEKQKNITLTEPPGQELATKLANSILAWAQKTVGFPFARQAHTNYFEHGGREFWLSVPYNVDDVTVATWDSLTNDYTPYPGLVRHDGARVVTAARLPSGFQAVRVTYTAGWDEEEFRATDLHQALVELLAQKWDSAASGGKDLKQVRVDGYWEEYFHDPTHTPADIMEVVSRYKRPIVL